MRPAGMTAVGTFLAIFDHAVEYGYMGTGEDGKRARQHPKKEGKGRGDLNIKSSKQQSQQPAHSS